MSESRIAEYSLNLEERFAADRFAMHQLIFAHRHEYPFAPFHKLLVEDFWSDERFFIDLGFRESGKTTLCEEGIAIAGAEGKFRNCLIIGAKEELAAELLLNIKTELENNEEIEAQFGSQRGLSWTSTKIVLRNGYCIQARGVGQNMRGTRHHNWRPDLVIVNDFEDDEDVLTPEGRRRTLRWFLKVLLPACDRQRRKIRIYDTVRDAESVPMMLIKREKWPHRFIPISYLDEAGREQPSWPGAMTMEWIERERQTYRSLGESDIWQREYMMNPESHADRVFSSEMIKVEPRVHTFEARWGMIDPARTVRRTSAATGWAVWSWERSRLTVWDGGAKMLMPDEIVDLAFRLSREFDLVELGIEEDGLNEWLAQPIRQRQVSEGSIPFRAVRAPRGKLDFIRGLQPFFSAGEVVFSGEMPDLREQLLGFPTGRIDAPNALAYALQLRPGRVIYEDWNPNVHIRPLKLGRGPFYLVANATRALLAGILIELDNGRIRALGDWIVEGSPDEATESLLRSASLLSGGDFTVIAGPQHFDQWHNVGLVAAFRNYGVSVRPGTICEKGRDFLRRELERTIAGVPAVAVSEDARWALRAFAGGYARALRNGYPEEEAQQNRYRVLMEGLESFCGLIAWGLEDETQQRNWMVDAQGRRYLSAMPARKQLDA